MLAKCKPIPIKETQSENEQYHGYIRTNKFKTIYQGQPSNIVVKKILSDSAFIKFDKIGNPMYYDVVLTSNNSTISYKVFTNSLQVINLDPVTTYTVNITAFYVSGDIYNVNHTKTFTTLSLWSVPSVTLIYPDNRTLIVDSNYNYVPIDMSFSFSPGKPSQYILSVPETGYEKLIDISYLVPKIYEIIIRNDISSTLNVITEYYDNREYEDVSFVYTKIIPPFEEGINPLLITPENEYMNVNIQKSPGNPIYNLYHSNNSNRSYNIIKTLSVYDSSGISIENLNPNTHQNFYIETIYLTNNSYKHFQLEHTLNKSPVQNIRGTPFLTSLNIAYDKPIGDFTNSSNYDFYLLDENDNEISYNNYLNNVTSITYEDLSINATYTFSATSNYHDGGSYDTSKSFQMLYEGSIRDLIYTNIKGISLYFEFTPFKLDSIEETSKPAFYTIIYTNLTTNVTLSLETYNTVDILYQILDPDTSYSFSVLSTYNTGNEYLYIGDDFKTLTEGPVTEILLDDKKGNRIDVSWNIAPFELINVPDVYFYLSVTDQNNSVIHSTQYENMLTYGGDSFYMINDLSHNTEYTLSFNSAYSNTGNTYARVLKVTTDDEYEVQLKTIKSEGFRFVIDKHDFNNQDYYYLLRESERLNLESFEWQPQTFTKNNTSQLYGSLQNDIFFMATMSKNTLVYAANYQYNKIEIFNTISVNTGFGTFDSQYKYNQTLPNSSKPLLPKIFSISLNYDGTKMLVGFNNDFMFLYTGSYSLSSNIVTFSQDEQNIPVINTTSREVFISPDGNICVASNEHSHHGLFIYNVGKDKSTTLNFRYVNFDSYNTVFNKYIDFNENGSIMVVGQELFIYPNNNDNSNENYVSFFDMSYDEIPQNICVKNDTIGDIPGSRVSLNKNGNKIAIVNNNDISNGNINSSVCIYNLNMEDKTLNEVTKYWSYNNSYKIIELLNCSINDDGTTIAISKYNYSYKNDTEPTNDGKIAIYDISDNNKLIQRGPTLLQSEDLPPSLVIDTRLPGEWYGFTTILDGTGNAILSTTRPKLNMKNNVYQGRSFINRWQNPLYAYYFDEWPLIIDNLEPSKLYAFEIVSTYNEDINYEYPFRFEAETLSNQKPDVSYAVSNNTITLSWIPVIFTEDDIGKNISHIITEVSYGLIVYDNNNNNNIIINTTIPYYYNENNVDNCSNTFEITGLNKNSNYSVNFSSIYLNLINGQNIVSEYSEDNIIKTLNQSSADVNNLILLNSSNLVVFDIINTSIDQVHKNIVEISNNIHDVSFEVIDTTLLDLSFVSLGETYNGFITTIYNGGNINNNDDSITYIDSSFVSNFFSFTVSNENPLIDYVTYGSNDVSYSDILNKNKILRRKVDVERGLYRTKPQEWKEDSNYIFVVENPTSEYQTITLKKFLDSTNDISYHYILHRSKDLFPGFDISASNLTQDLNEVFYSQYYKNTLFIALHDISNVYNPLEMTFFSDKVEYEIVLSDNDEEFYKSGPIICNDISWSKLSLIFKNPSSRKNVTYTLRRLKHEYNNLFVSDITMFNSLTPIIMDPFWKTTYNDNSWNTTSSQALSTWKDTFQDSDEIYNVIKLSSNMSVSLWFYTHSLDVSESIFLLGTDICNGTPNIVIDNNKIYVENVLYESTEKTSVSTTYDNLYSHHFVCTFFNNIVQIYIDGILNITKEIGDSYIKNADTSYNIYLGNPNDVSFGVVMKHTELYNYQLDYATINAMYVETSKEYDSPPNAYDLSFTKTVILENDNPTTPISLPFKNNPYLTKKLTFNTSPIYDLLSNSIVSNNNVLSFWMRENSEINLKYDNADVLRANLLVNSKLQLTIKTETYIIDLKSSNSYHHISIGFASTTTQIFLNGFYHSFYQINSFSGANKISYEDIAEIYKYNRLLTDYETLTAYYNYYKFYNVYDTDLGKYVLYLEYPKGSINNNISYEIKDLPQYINLEINGEFDYVTRTQNTLYDSSYIIINISENEMNLLNKNSDKFQIDIEEFNMSTTVNGSGMPYISHSYNEIQYLCEGLSLEFIVYNIEDDVSFELLGINISDIDANDLSGNISPGIPFEILLINDYLVENIEKLTFRIPSLKIMTSIDIYDEILLFTRTRYINYYNSSTSTLGYNVDDTNEFVIYIRSKFQNTFYFSISGIPESDLSYQQPNNQFSDISFANTEQQNLMSSAFYDDFPNEESSTSDTFNDTSFSYYKARFILSSDILNRDNYVNIPFILTLSGDNDLDKYSITVMINDFFEIFFVDINDNIITNTHEGSNIIAKIKTPTYIQNGQQYDYIIDGITQDDMNKPLIGTVTINDTIGTLPISIKRDPNITENEILTFSISGDGFASIVGDFEFDISAQLSIIEVIPNFIFSTDASLGYVHETDVCGNTFTITITDLNNTQTDGTTIPFIITGVDQSDYYVGSSIEDNVTEFVMNNFTDTINVTIINDLKTEGQEFFHLYIKDFPESSITISIIDTSKFTEFNLVTSSTEVNEGDTFTITFSSVNVEIGTVIPYIISGITRPDIFGIGSLVGSFTVGSDEVKTFFVREDSLTEGSETAVFTLVDYPVREDSLTEGSETAVFTLVDYPVSVSVLINDTSESPRYYLDIYENDLRTLNMYQGSTYRVEINTENVNKGSRIFVKIGSFNDENSLSKENIYSVSNNNYYMMFISGYTNSLSFTVTTSDVLNPIHIEFDGNIQFIYGKPNDIVSPELRNSIELTLNS